MSTLSDSYTPIPDESVSNPIQNVNLSQVPNLGFDGQINRTPVFDSKDLSSINMEFLSTNEPHNFSSNPTSSSLSTSQKHGVTCSLSLNSNKPSSDSQKHQLDSSAKKHRSDQLSSDSQKHRSDQLSSMTPSSDFQKLDNSAKKHRSDSHQKHQLDSSVNKHRSSITPSSDSRLESQRSHHQLDSSDKKHQLSPNSSSVNTDENRQFYEYGNNDRTDVNLINFDPNRPHESQKCYLNRPHSRSSYSRGRSQNLMTFPSSPSNQPPISVSNISQTQSHTDRRRHRDSRKTEYRETYITNSPSSQFQHSDMTPDYSDQQWSEDKSQVCCYDNQDSQRAYVYSDWGSNEVGENLYQVAKQHEIISRFVRSLKKFPDIIKALKHSPNLTILAPANEFWTQVENSNPEQIRQLMLYHIIPQRYPLVAFENNKLVPTLDNNLKIRTTIFSQPTFRDLYTLNILEIERPNIWASNGLIHVLRGVLCPPINTINDFMPIISVLTGFNQLLNLSTPQFRSILSTSSNLTLFAPTTEALTRYMTSNRLNTAQMSGKQIDILLKQHLLDQIVITWALNQGQTLGILTTNGTPLIITNNCGQIIIGESAKIIYPNILTANGVLQIIDNIISPPVLCS